MKVRDILQVKGTALYCISPDAPLREAVTMMESHDIGSVVVVEHEKVVGMLTFREVLKALTAKEGALDATTVRNAMDDAFMSGTMEMSIEELRRLILDRHARYLPILDGGHLMGVISLFDVAQAVVKAQGFENQMLKAYIRDWPHEETSNDEAHS